MNAKQWFAMANRVTEEVYTHHRKELLEAEALGDTPYIEVAELLEADVVDMPDGQKARTVVNLLMLQAYKHDNAITNRLAEFQREIEERQSA